MKALVCAAARRRNRRASPVGQVLYQSSGTFKWICPPDVTRVSVALVGAGGSGKAAAGNTGNGGNVGYIPAGRGSQGIDLKTFAATSPTGTFSRTGGQCGGGGGFWRDRDNAGAGGSAGVRIIWGDNRAFPSTNIGDM